MPRPRTLFMRGNSGAVSGSPYSSIESAWRRARMRTLEPHAEQLGRSRSKGPSPEFGAPQTLQVKTMTRLLADGLADPAAEHVAQFGQLDGFGDVIVHAGGEASLPHVADSLRRHGDDD